MISTRLRFVVAFTLASATQTVGQVRPVVPPIGGGLPPIIVNVPPPTGGTGTTPPTTPTLPPIPDVGSTPVVAGGGDPPSGAPVITIPIPPDCYQQRWACDTLEAVDFANTLRRITTANDPKKDVVDYMARVIGNRPVLISLPPLTVDRAAVIQQIIRLEFKSLDIVTDRLREDVRHLHPFYNITTEERARNKELVRRDDEAVTRQKKKARQEVDEEESRMESHRPREYQPKLGDAYRQLVYASKTGAGIPRSW